MSEIHQRLRPARPEDAKGLQEIARLAYELYLPRMDRPPAPMLADYRPLIAAGQVDVLEEGDRILGFIVAFPREGDYFVENLAVAPACQGAGHGRFLMAAAEARAREQGFARVRLYTNAVMTENLAFYHRLGYCEEDKRLEDGYHRVYFVKML
jgi:ribosomal protein S18 acetylase RimI-like enzyme